MTKAWKKLSAVCMALILTFSVTACSGGGDKNSSENEDTGRTAQEILESNYDKSKDLKDVDMTSKIEYEIAVPDTSADDSSDDSESQTLTMDYDAKISDSGSDSMAMAMTGKMSSSGTSIDMNIYYSDGYYYINMLGQKIKQKMDLSKLQKELEATTNQTQLPVENYKDIVVSQNSEGNTVLDYKLNDDGLDEYIKEIADQMGAISSSSVSSDDLDSVKISSFSGQRTLNKDDYTIKESVKFVMENKQSDDGSITISMDITYKNSGKDVTVTLPDDLSDYQESSSLSLN
ncbi:hypothetical protein [Anaerostipes butyraticus]|uniref:Lipoprotein n=1 Tax=Anaerostipes butyraticus TaxID=645466 RepID=A0A916QCI3_9FIRM|nr:hypothetical protein [Anaerostipes butyraticus]GFO85979.1 hypothetical protein ANBU17_23260 [Anaerostipes butyraticus]HJC82044.1 hypothetical protein [Candidatus Anaerostipes avicola]